MRPQHRPAIASASWGDGEANTPPDNALLLQQIVSGIAEFPLLALTLNVVGAGGEKFEAPFVLGRGGAFPSQAAKCSEGPFLMCGFTPRPALGVS